MSDTTTVSELPEDVKDALRWRAPDQPPEHRQIAEVAFADCILTGDVGPDGGMAYVPKLTTATDKKVFTGEVRGISFTWDDSSVRGWRPMVESVNTLFSYAE